MQAGELWVQIGAKLGDLDNALRQAEGKLQNFKTKYEGFAAMGDRLKGFGSSMTMFVTAPIVAAGAAMGKLGMDAIESENLFTVSMGEMAGAADQWAEGMSNAFGLYSVEVKKNLGMMNSMLDNMGMGTQASFEMSKGLTQLSYDMASFYNLNPEEAFEKLRSGITGEIEPLKSLGINVSETAVQMYAWQNGIAKTGEQLTEAQKVIARYGLILKSTGDAQGDLARTMDSPANQMRALSAQVKSLANDMGQYLIPIIGNMVIHIRQSISWFAGLSAGTKTALLAFAGLAAAIGPVTYLIGAVMKGFSTWATMAGNLRKALDWLKNTTIMQTIATQGLNAAMRANPVGAVITVVMALGAACYALYKAWVNNWGGIQEKTFAVLEMIKVMASRMVNSVSYAFQALKANIYKALQGIASAVSPFFDIIGGIAPSIKTSFDGIKDNLASKVGDIQIELDTLTAKAEESDQRLNQARKGIQESFSSWATPGSDKKEESPWESAYLAELQKYLAEADAAANTSANKQKGAADKTKQAWSGSADAVRNSLALMKTEHEKLAIVMSDSGGELDNLKLKYSQLGEEIEGQTSLVETLRRELAALATQGVTKDSTRQELVKNIDETKLKIAEEEKALAELKSEYLAVSDSIKTYSDALKTTENLQGSLQLLQTQHETARNEMQLAANDAEVLKLKQSQLTEEMSKQTQIIDSLKTQLRELEAADLATAKSREEQAKRVSELKQQLADEQKTLSEMRVSYQETGRSIQDHIDTLNELKDSLEEVQRKYREDMASALDDYQAKVADTNAKLLADEQKLNDDYEKMVTDRASSLANFTGLFDQVGTKQVSGTELLGNLKGQVSAFDSWREDIQDLAAKGVDEGLIAELRKMGPKAGPEIAALNTLTSEQLTEYVALWKEKQADARDEAGIELSKQKDETVQKISDLRAAARSQLEQYRKDWADKVAEIRKNTTEESERIAKKFSDLEGKAKGWGIALIENFAAGIEAAMPVFNAAIDGAIEKAKGLDPNMRHSPSLVDRVRAGIKDIIEAYQTLPGELGGIKSAIAGIGSAALTNTARAAAVPAAVGTTYNQGGNTIVFNVSGGWDEIKRELQRLGIKLG